MMLRILSIFPRVSNGWKQFPFSTAGDKQPWADPVPIFPCRPQGKSYLYFTQFKAEVRGADIEYGMAYVSIGRTFWGGRQGVLPCTVPFRPLEGQAK